MCYRIYTLTDSKLIFRYRTRIGRHDLHHCTKNSCEINLRHAASVLVLRLRLRHGICIARLVTSILISKVLRTPRMEWATLPLIPSNSSSQHIGRYSFPVPQRVGGWVRLGGWLLPRWYARPKKSHPSGPSTNRPIVRRPGIELTTIESQVRRPNH